jgi:hypothetical protein
MRSIILTSFISFVLIFFPIAIQHYSTAAEKKGSEPLYTKVQEAIDWWDPEVRGFALSAISPKHGGKYNIAQVCDIWEKIYRDWVYVSDPALGREFEYIAASKTIQNGLRGDCDDFAVLVAATIVAIGGRARVTVMEKSGEGANHAFPELYLGNSEEEAKTVFEYLFTRYRIGEINYSKDPEGIWLNLDWTANYPGGPYWGDKVICIFYPRGDRGKFEVQPTLHQWKAPFTIDSRLLLLIVLFALWMFLGGGSGSFWKVKGSP